MSETTHSMPRELHAVLVDGEGNEPEYMCLAPQPEDPADSVAFSGNFRMVPDAVTALWEELARRWNAHADLLAACEMAERFLANALKAVDWGSTHNLDIDALNRALMMLPRAIAKATGAN